MLKQLFPRDHARYSSLPLLGATLDGFAQYLTNNGYPLDVARCRLRAVISIDRRLRRYGCRDLMKVTREKLRKCAPAPGHSKENIHASATVRLLEKYLDEQDIFPAPEPLKPAEEKLASYSRYLETVRGLAPSTVKHHLATISEFLSHLEDRGGLSYLPKLTSRDTEDFVQRTGKRISRASLQHTIAYLRSFLRFLAVRNEAPVGLDSQIDTPRLYRGEKLPRSLPWETVNALLESIDRSSPIGVRDYAMLLLAATYGLRASEIVALKLEDINWCASRLHICQKKTAAPLVLPLTAHVGNSIVDYLRQGRPQVPYREVFVRHRAPAGTLKSTAVTEVFQSWSRRSGLQIPYQGPHCIRHSYAVHLLRQGTSLKTIGDILGHRSSESTCVYLRLAVDDLRSVPLSLPVGSSQEVRHE